MLLLQFNSKDFQRFQRYFVSTFLQIILKEQQKIYCKRGANETAPIG